MPGSIDPNTGIIDEFLANGGKVGGYFEGATLLILHTKGVKTGLARIKPLDYLPDGDRFVGLRHEGWCADRSVLGAQRPRGCGAVGRARRPCRCGASGGDRRARGGRALRAAGRAAPWVRRIQADDRPPDPGDRARSRWVSGQACPPSRRNPTGELRRRDLQEEHRGPAHRPAVRPGDVEERPHEVSRGPRRAPRHERRGSAAQEASHGTYPTAGENRLTDLTASTPRRSANRSRPPAPGGRAP